ncbi:hypothetical protein CC2G_002337 [Coprinopsis cinerea AmutBmut pab1-1]|nr:hypothetical protein CC2G_002337 [Coprinopsis cinerea AmutBmut pab1-1]
MADDYGYPSDLDSDDGSILWDQESRSDDADSLVTSLDSLSLDGGSPPSVGICIVCLARPIYSKNGRTYSTCGMRCAAILQSATQGAVASSGTAGRGFHTHGPDGARARIQKIPRPPCVICKKNPSYRGAVTCGLTCLEKLAKDGGDPTMCNYCHRKPKHGSYPQCGTTCAEKAKLACLFCRCRPRLGRYHLCGRTCKRLAVKQTPLLLEAPKGHATYEMVEQRFIKAWITNSSGPRPAISKVFKIIENEDFLKPYDAYRYLVSCRPILLCLIHSLPAFDFADDE